MLSSIGFLTVLVWTVFRCSIYLFPCTIVPWQACSLLRSLSASNVPCVFSARIAFLDIFSPFHWFLYIPMVQLFIAMPSWQLVFAYNCSLLYSNYFMVILISCSLLHDCSLTWLFWANFFLFPAVVGFSHDGFLPWLLPAMIVSCHDCFLPWLFLLWLLFAMIVSCHDCSCHDCSLLHECFLPWMFPTMIFPSYMIVSCHDCSLLWFLHEWFLLRFSPLRFRFNLFHAMVLPALLIVPRFC